jgi:glutaconate CoA-transferase subunit B
MPRTIEFTDTEFMIAQGARLIEDGKTIFVGWGIPQVVAMLAQKLYVPNVTQLFEFGAIGPQSVLPFVRGTMGGPQNTYRSLQWLNMNWAFAYSATGYMDYGMLGALQVDPYGNINSTHLGGTFANPERRFAGSGGGLALLEDDHRHQARGTPVRPEGGLPHLPGFPRRPGSP